MKRIVIIILTVALFISGFGYATLKAEKRTPVEFFPGHAHLNGVTINAPQHSGGTNSMGCHNGSVPYHCH